MIKGDSDMSLLHLAKTPQYVLDHAPRFHLFSGDRYRPSSIAAHTDNTHPEIDFKPVSIPTPPCTLENLNQLNDVGANGGKDVYLTCNEDVTTSPKWLEGAKVQANGGTGDEKTGIIIIVNKGGGRVDAFFFLFFAYNWGGVIREEQLGVHIGNWEHTMIRFENGIPKYVWLSQQSNGEAFTFSCLQKDTSGKRPLLYIANGSHATDATTGTHDHTIPDVNLLLDETDAGPLYDPLLNSYHYTYNHSTATLQGTFVPHDSSSPEGFLYFLGRWGDREHPSSDPRQIDELFGWKKYVDGPTGPVGKQLNREEVWPESEFIDLQRIRTSLDGSTWLKDRLVQLNIIAEAARRKIGA